MKFTKMHGAGNDFVVINAMEETLPADLNAFAKKIADRHFGVGCDQILLIDKSDSADFKMRILNHDGGEVEMCGNGIRCLARFAHERGLTDKKKITVETLGGIIKPEIVGDRVKVDMGEPRLQSKNWNFGMDKVIAHELNVGERPFKVTLVSMGNPHCVVFADDLGFDLPVLGPLFENHSSFPNRINTEFVKVLNEDEVEVRVWERGAGETLACGTGASAVGVACVLNNKTNRGITVHLAGGDLGIEWSEDNHVYMTGSAEFVFDGVI
ncbi:diaminopimelate epimerase [archaeon]